MTLKGEKTVLRPAKMSDAPRFVKWFADPEVNQFVATRNISLEEEKKYIKELPKKLKNDDYHFCIDTKEGVHIGSIGLKKDKVNNYGTFGIVIGDKDYWSDGYGTDAARAIIDFGFKELKLHKISLDGGVYDYNARAIRAYEKLGFKKEGVNRECILFKGKYHDVVIMGMLSKEWKGKK